VFLFEGANDTKRNYRPADGSLGGWAVAPPVYEKTYRDILAQLTARGIKTIVMTHAPGDPRSLDFFRQHKAIFAEGGNLFCMPDEVARCVALQKQLAAEFNLDVIDTHALLTKYMADQIVTGHEQHLHVDDGVHLSEFGNREVARILLEYLR